MYGNYRTQRQCAVRFPVPCFLVPMQLFLMVNAALDVELVSTLQFILFFLQI